MNRRPLLVLAVVAMAAGWRLMASGSELRGGQLLGGQFGAAVTPTPTAASTPTPILDEKVTTHRFQSSCGTFASIAVGAKEERCLQWNMAGDVDALGTTAADYAAWCDVQSAATPVLIPVVVDHITSQTTGQVCAILFNRNGSSAQAGSWCCHAYRWGETPP